MILNGRIFGTNISLCGIALAIDFFWLKARAISFNRAWLRGSWIGALVHHDGELAEEARRGVMSGEGFASAVNQDGGDFWDCLRKRRKGRDSKESAGE
jgi:hypothetical protein